MCIHINYPSIIMSRLHMYIAEVVGSSRGARANNVIGSLEEYPSMVQYFGSTILSLVNINENSYIRHSRIYFSIYREKVKENAQC